MIKVVSISERGDSVVFPDSKVRHEREVSKAVEGKLLFQYPLCVLVGVMTLTLL